MRVSPGYAKSKGGSMINQLAVRQQATKFAVGLVASYCRGCGLLIAASPRRKTLDIMENVHHCPVYFHYEHQPERENASVTWQELAGRPARLLVYLE